jgi:hypothetical protein
MYRPRFPRPPGYYLPRPAHRVRERRRAEALDTWVGICPRCGGPMTARCGKNGPYFHCLCYERAREATRWPTK